MGLHHRQSARENTNARLLIREAERTREEKIVQMWAAQAVAEQQQRVYQDAVDALASYEAYSPVDEPDEPEIEAKRSQMNREEI